MSLIKGLTGITEDKLRNELEPATRQAILKFIRGVFKRQIVVGRLKNDPTAGLAVKTKKKRSYPTVMTQEEIFKVIDYAKSIDADWAKEWAYVYEVAYYTGARSGELYALKWSDVELDNIGAKRIYIKKSYDWKTETLKNTKGKSDRVVPVNKDLEKVLRELKKKYPNAEFVLPRIPDWKQGKSAEQLKTYQRDLDIKPTKFHSIRATTITNLLLNSMPLVKVQALVGHEEIQTTMLYLASIGDEVQGVTDCLSREDNVVKADFKAKKSGKR